MFVVRILLLLSLSLYFHLRDAVTVVSAYISSSSNSLRTLKQWGRSSIDRRWILQQTYTIRPTTTIVHSTKDSSNNDNNYWDDNDDDEEEEEDYKYDDDNNNKSDNIIELRHLLEASWNTKTMGPVPTTAELAAESAADAIRTVLDEKEGGVSATKKINPNILYVDILLPQYDIQQGSRIYDELLVIEFCIKLAKQLQITTTTTTTEAASPKKCNIVVRDSNVLQTLSRILNARENRNVTEIITEVNNTYSPTNLKVDDNLVVTAATDSAIDEIVFTDTATITSTEENSLVEFYDDFADFGYIGGESVSINLITTPTTTSPKLSEESIPLQAIDSEKTSSTTTTTTTTTKPDFGYRLSSMLGNARISKGSDMLDDVFDAVAENVQVLGTERIIMIVSAVTKEEIIGIRSIIQRYGKNTDKLILLINCQFPDKMITPRELIQAQTAYSILPLIARPKGSKESELSSSSSSSKDRSPKVVVLRRYPRDWEVYVDLNDKGFELAGSVPASSVDRKKGPSKEWITKVVTKFLESSF